MKNEEELSIFAAKQLWPWARSFGRGKVGKERGLTEQQQDLLIEYSFAAQDYRSTA